MNKAKDVIAKQSGKKSLHANFYVITCNIVASGDLSKNFTRKLIFLVANATVLVAVWSPDVGHRRCASLLSIPPELRLMAAGAYREFVLISLPVLVD